jgi:uroporphyrin-III C-methyltransferase
MNLLTSIGCTASLVFLSLFIRSRIKRENARNRKPGKVYLVGAGPGATDLITLRGLQLLKSADVVLNDRLVSPQLLSYCKRGCKILNVGKGSDKERFAQNELEKELIEAAKSAGPDGVVVRLKGGDPYVYGLGASEALALNEAGIEWEYVPGLSSATALPGLCLQAPLTHKGVSLGFIVLSGHIPPTVNSEWGQLPKCSEPLLTLVVVMCAKNLKCITEYLRTELAWSPNIPSAVIQSGSTSEERVLRSTLEAIADEAVLHNIDKAPLSLVIGRTLDVFSEAVQITRKVKDEGTAWGVSRLNEISEREWWVFGYGSLIWKSSADIPHTHVEDGYIEGYIRRFWQSSPDHRGTETSPGRVVTIVSMDDARKVMSSATVEPEKVFGRVFRVDAAKIDETREKLLFREKAGYGERTVEVTTKTGRKIRASVFLALPGNEHFVGPEPVSYIAQRVLTSIGPSGLNVEYFDELFTALADMQIRWGESDRVIDAHILEIAHELSILRGSNKSLPTSSTS